MVVAGVLVAGPPAFGPAAVAQSRVDPADAAFVPGPCPFAVPEGEIVGETLACGRLTVPMVHDALSGDLDAVASSASHEGAVVELQVVVLHARSPRPATPIVYLEGGPGAPAVSYVPTWWIDSPLRNRADLIVFDQRGTGFSTPSLDCWEWYLAGVSHPEAACRSRLARDGVDLAHFGSDDSAEDVVALLDAFGIERADLVGSSYGTRLALTVLRRSPERVRAVVLDGVYPPDAEHLERQGTFGYGALAAVFAACSGDDACDAAFPSLDRALTAAVHRLDVEPLHGTGGPPLTGQEAYHALVDLLYDGSAAASVPALVYAAWRRDAAAWRERLDAARGPWPSDEAYRAGVEELLAWLAGTTDPEERPADLWARAEGLFDDDAEAMYYAVECAEEAAFTDPADAGRRIAALPAPFAFLERDVSGFLAACHGWNVAPGAPDRRATVTSDVPTLLLSGAFDPITPPILADETARHLTTAHAFVFPTIGHGVLGASACGTEVTLAFLEHPERRPAPACLDALPSIRFVVP